MKKIIENIYQGNVEINSGNQISSGGYIRSPRANYVNTDGTR